MTCHFRVSRGITTNVRRLAVVTEFKKPKMNKEDFILELGKAIAVDGRVNVDRYCRVLELVDAYISSNYSKPIVSGSSSVEKRYKCLLCGRDKFTAKQPHKCRDGFRKRKIQWAEVE